MSEHSFRFVDDDLTGRLIALLKRNGIWYVVDEKGAVHYRPEDEAVVENDFINSIRDRVFSSWQVLSCPEDWTDRYRQYMTEHGIPYREEWSDGQVCFLLPRKYRPHRWKLDDEVAAAAK